MGFDQDHESSHELPAATRVYARTCLSPAEEVEAIGEHQQPPASESDAAAAHTA